MDLPDDVLATIAEITPDPRPLLLTCRQFYRVFTEMPDIAYWCSGRDPQFLLPKHYPDVWCGNIYHIINADNVELFKSAAKTTDRSKWGRYMIPILESDSVKIFTYIREEFSDVIYFNIDLLVIRYAAVKIMAYLGLDPIGKVQPADAAVARLYKIYGQKISKTYGKPHILGAFSFDDLLAHKNIDALLWYAERSNTMPEIPWRSVISAGKLRHIKSYLRIYKRTITVEMLKYAADLMSRNYVKIYRLSGLDIPELAPNLDAVSGLYFSINMKDVRYYESVGHPLVIKTNYPMLTNNRKLLEYFLQSDKNVVQESVSRRCINYTTDDAKLFDKYGIKYNIWDLQPTSVKQLGDSIAAYLASAENNQDADISENVTAQVFERIPYCYDRILNERLRNVPGWAEFYRRAVSI